jgi:hypothetical protein
MMYLVALALLSIVPVGDVTRESCAAIHVNHFHDEYGRLVFDQAIFRGHDGKVIAWRLIKSPSQIPERDWANGGYVATWHDGEQIRQIRPKSEIEDWTQYDPELLAREVLPKEQRKELRCVRWDKPSGAIRPSPIPVAAPDLP